LEGIKLRMGVLSRLTRILRTDNVRYGRTPHPARASLGDALLITSKSKGMPERALIFSNTFAESIVSVLKTPTPRTQVLLLLAQTFTQELVSEGVEI
jgi:hypothetical protein